jgi:hypothetical protein
MALRDLSGVGALHEALGETNAHLAAVLRELQEINGQRFVQVTEELHNLNAKLDRLLTRPSELPTTE